MKNVFKSTLFRVTAVAIIIYIIFEVIFLTALAYTRQSALNELYIKTDTVQTQIEKVFQSTITISDGYLSFMTSNLDATKEETETFLDHLLFYDENYVKNIAVIEETTIKFNYPYEENQSSIGIDLALIDGQKDDILFVKNNLESLFVGPVELVQGGQAFIIRIPILDGDEYWGQIATVIDADHFIETIQTEADENDVNVRITYESSGSNIIEIGNELTGDIISSTYTNKYIEWDLEVSEREINKRIFERIFSRFVAITVIYIISYYFYRSSKLNKEIMYNAIHDYLTGDFNRSKFILDYEENLFDGKLIAFTDVNKFKILNDTLGHLFGDWCLKQLSFRFNELENFTTYRISGDEFILVSKIPMSVSEFKKQLASTKFEFYNEELQQDVDLEISIGVLERLAETVDFESMLMYLDYAMYDAKNANKVFTVVNDELMKKYEEIKIIEQQLIEDIKKNNLIPYYQPIINLENGKIDGFEVLSRWLYKGEIRSAAMFIGVVKKVKYVDLVDRNLFNKVQEEYTELQKEYPALQDLTFSINLSAESLMIFEKDHSKFDRFVKNQVISKEKTIFEISEDMNLGVISIETLRYVQSKGYNIVVDDFGAGVSKLSDVLSGELRAIKTDKSLLPSKKANDKKIDGFYTIIKAIRASGSTICVEGIETIDQVEMAIDAGGRLAQGFLFGRPMPKEDVLDFIKNFNFSDYKKS